MSAYCSISVSDSLPVAEALPLPTDPPLPATPVPVMTLVPLFAPATPIHREMAICDGVGIGVLVTVLAGRPG